MYRCVTERTRKVGALTVLYIGHSCFVAVKLAKNWAKTANLRVVASCPSHLLPSENEDMSCKSNFIDQFVFRREPNPDAGVDGHIELKRDARYLNLRAQIQVEGTDSDDLNDDGSATFFLRRVDGPRYRLGSQRRWKRRWANIIP
jgi:hypothetical protein